MARPKLTTPNFRLVRRPDSPNHYVAWTDPESGKPRWVSTRTGDAGEAQAFLNQFVAGWMSPAAPAEPLIRDILGTLDLDHPELATGYLADRHGKVRSITTLIHAVAALTRHLGNLTPDQLTQPVIDGYADKRMAETYRVGRGETRRQVGPATVQRELVTLRAGLRWAIALKWPVSPPTFKMPVTGDGPRERWLTRPEAAALIDACPRAHLRLFVRLALGTGARREAILQLTWDRVDLDGPRGVVDFGRGHGKKRRARRLPIHEPLLGELRAAYEARTTDHVIEFHGKPIGTVDYGLAEASRLAGIDPPVTAHMLRHTAATWMVQDGVPEEEIARFLNITTKMVREVYGHHAPGYLARAAEAVAV